MLGVNLASCKGEDAKELRHWYKGPTLVDLLGIPICSALAREDILYSLPRQIGATSP